MFKKQKNKLYKDIINGYIAKAERIERSIRESTKQLLDDRGKNLKADILSQLKDLRDIIADVQRFCE